MTDQTRTGRLPFLFILLMFVLSIPFYWFNDWSVLPTSFHMVDPPSYCIDLPALAGEPVSLSRTRVGPGQAAVEKHRRRQADQKQLQQLEKRPGDGPLPSDDQRERVHVF